MSDRVGLQKDRKRVIRDSNTNTHDYLYMLW